MSEPKLCPMTFPVPNRLKENHENECVQDECAWWVGKKTIYVSATHLTPACELNMDGHCVALDW
jgi:hypothetical protein